VPVSGLVAEPPTRFGEYGQHSENLRSGLHLVLRKLERTGNSRKIADIVMESLLQQSGRPEVAFRPFDQEESSKIVSLGPTKFFQIN
jgi:hypothetical protein